MINSSPKIMGLTVDFHKDLIKMPFPIWVFGNWVHSFLADLPSEEWAKFVPPIPDRFMANINASFMEEIFYISKRKWKSDIHHHGETNDLRWCFKIAKRIGILYPKTLWECCDIVKVSFPLTVPTRDLYLTFDFKRNFHSSIFWSNFAYWKVAW